MKTKHFIFPLFLAACTMLKFAEAQTIVPASLRQETEFSLPPLEVVIDSALSRSASIRFRLQEIEAKQSNLTSQKNYWTRNLGFQGEARYGTFNNFSTIETGQTSGLLTLNTSQVNYSAGAYIKFPLFDLINRKNQVKQASIEVEQARSMAEAMQDELRQMVIRLYQDVLLKQRVLLIRSESAATSRVNMDMVENQFRNGVIPVAEYVRISDIVFRTTSDYEVARAEFTAAKAILEDIAGFSFSKPANAFTKAQ
jgi:outer membrane protein TolC